MGDNINMSLDTVELVIAAEETFQITLNDEELPKISTVGNLYELILKSLNHHYHGMCLTSHTFYQLRGALMRLDHPRNQLFPKQNIERIFPKPNRDAKWHKLAKQLNLKLPELQRPKWFSWLLRFSFLFWLVGSILGGILGILTPWQMWLSIALSIGLTWGAYQLSKPLAIDFPQNMMTIGELTKEILHLNFGQIYATAKQWHEKDVWESLKRLLIEQFGIKPVDIVKSARFVEDLGMD